MKNTIKIVLFLFTIILINSCEKQVSKSLVTAPELNLGKAFVNSNPSGASIFFDGRNSGKVTPDTIVWLEEKPYKITLKKQYFLDTSFTLNISKDSISSLYFDYTLVPKMYGKIFVDSNPRNAKIFFDGEYTGETTPATLEDILPGEYKVVLKIPNHWNDTTLTFVRSSKLFYINKNLIDTTVWVTFNTTNSPIVNNYLTSLAIDEKSNIWIGSSGYGLYKFNNYNWDVFNIDNSPLPDNYIKNIQVSKNNKILISTISGLAIYDYNSWIVFTPENSAIPSYQITSAIITNDGDLWISTSDMGIAKYDGTNWQNFNPGNSPLPSYFINYLENDKFGNLWIATYGSGIIKYNGENWEIFNNSNSGLPSSNNPKSIKIDDTGKIWFAFGGLGLFGIGGYVVFNNGDWESHQSSPSSKVNDLAFDNNGYIWFANQETGAARFDGVDWKYFTTKNSGLRSSFIYKIIIDPAGNKWFATYGGGLTKYKGE